MFLKLTPKYVCDTLRHDGPENYSDSNILVDGVITSITMTGLLTTMIQNYCQDLKDIPDVPGCKYRLLYDGMITIGLAIEHECLDVGPCERLLSFQLCRPMTNVEMRNFHAIGGDIVNVI